MTPRLNLLAIVAALVIAMGQLVAGAISLRDTPAGDVGESAPRMTATSNPAELRPGSVSTELWQARPLFVASRRPPDAPAKPREEAKAPKLADVSDLKLLAIFIDGMAASALVDAKGSSLRLALGDEVRGWRVRAIGADHLVLEAGAETRRLALYPPRETEARAR